MNASLPLTFSCLEFGYVAMYSCKGERLKMQSFFYVVCPDTIVNSIILKNNERMNIGVQLADSARVFNEV